MNWILSEFDKKSEALVRDITLSEWNIDTSRSLWPDASEEELCGLAWRVTEREATLVAQHAHITFDWDASHYYIEAEAQADELGPAST